MGKKKNPDDPPFWWVVVHVRKEKPMTVNRLSRALTGWNYDPALSSWEVGEGIEPGEHELAPGDIRFGFEVQGEPGVIEGVPEVWKFVWGIVANVMSELSPPPETIRFTYVEIEEG